MERTKGQPVLTARIDPDGRVSTECFQNPLVDEETQDALQVYASTFLKAVDKEKLSLEEAQAKARAAARRYREQRVKEQKRILTGKRY